MTPEDDPLLQPFTLKHLTLRNRVVSTSHEPKYHQNGMPADRYRAYHVEKARGGIGLTMIGGGAIVSVDSTPSFGNLHMYKDEIVAHLRRLSDEVHDAGAAVMSQLTHLGHRTSNYAGDRLPAVSVTNWREPAHRAFAKEAEPDDLERIAADFGDAAARCRAGGLDGVELIAYGHLIDAFWSPALNTRTDEFGGSQANRMRFPLMVIEAVRKAVGPDFIVGVRMALDEELPGGLDAAQGMRIAREVTAAGVDFISVIQGHIGTEDGLSRVIPPMGERSAPHLELAAAAKRELSVPVMHAAKIADVATARYAIAEGKVDLVGMTRAHIADPHIVAKLRRGEADRIRPCVGASSCIDAGYSGETTFCLHNASTGRELSLPHVIERAPARRTATVVGAGPAGLEAARVLAERGHDVTVYEASGRPGGQLLLAARAPRRRDLVGIVDWRVAECRRYGVRFVFNRTVEASDLLDDPSDVVIVATGGLPNTGGLDGADLVHDTWDVLSGEVRPTGRVLVFDDNDGHQGLDVVDALVTDGAAGVEVEWVTPERTLAVGLGAVNASPYLRMLIDRDVRITPMRRLRSVTRDGGRLRAVLGAEGTDTTVTRVVDHVVAEHGTLPNADVYHGLKPYSVNDGVVDFTELLALRPQTVVRRSDGRFRLYRIGDAVSSRSVHSAVLDAFRLCAAV
ncbi:MAG TPA: FAD-dependent oxidoreductase [Streptosporangiaceae bacterium]